MTKNKRTILNMLRNAVIMATIFVFFGYYIPRLQAQFIGNEHYFTLRRPVSLGRSEYKIGDKPNTIVDMKVIGDYRGELTGEIVECETEREINGVVISKDILIEESEAMDYEVRQVENLIVPEFRYNPNQCYFYSLNVCYYIQFGEEKCFSFTTDTFYIVE